LGTVGQYDSFALNPDSALLAVATFELDATGTLYFWNLKSGATLQPIKGIKGRVNSISWRPDGSAFVTAGGDGTVRLWDAKTHQQIGSWQVADTVVKPCGCYRDVDYEVSFSPDGQRLAMYGKDLDPGVWLWAAQGTD